MSDLEQQDEILTREELDALLSTLAEERRDKEQSERLTLRAHRDPTGLGRIRQSMYPALARALEVWAVELGRRLSTHYQTVIQCQLRGWEAVTLAELAETVPHQDVVAVMEIGPPRGFGFVLISRPMLFGLLALSFGARPSLPNIVPPSRPYSRIERRFYRRLAKDLTGQLEHAWGELVEAKAEVIAIDEPERLLEEPHESVILASIDVSGLGEFTRLRLALPPTPFDKLQETKVRLEPARRADVENVVMDMPVDLRVEAGHTNVSLSELTNLRVGELIPLLPSEDGALLIKVAGEPKFRGVRGSVGSRLAVQVTERV